MIKHIRLDDLRKLITMGFQPIPLTDNRLGQIPNVADILTAEEIEESKRESNDTSEHPVHYIRDHPDFWTKIPKRLEKESWRFVNVATTMGKVTVNNRTYRRHEVDIDSQEVYNRLKDFIEKIRDKTIIVKTRKLTGYRIYWYEATNHKNVITTYCKTGHNFEIKCESGISTLPPSCHRDEEEFHYYFDSNSEKIGICDGLYDKLIKEALGDCLKDGWNKEDKFDGTDFKLKQKVYRNLTESQIEESVRCFQFLYTTGFRNPLVYEISGLAFKNCVSLTTCLEIIKRLATASGDEEIRSRLLVVKNTYHNGELGRQISGYSGLVRVITSSKRYMDEGSAERFISSLLEEVWNDNKGNNKTGTVTKRKARTRKSHMEKPKKVIKSFKYSDNGRVNLHESIIVNRRPKFISYDPATNKMELKDSIEETTRIISPFDTDEYPNTPYEFRDEGELDEYFKKAKLATKDSLFYRTQDIVTRYIDQDKSITTQLTTDLLISYMQDVFSTIHYDFAVGVNEVGKSVFGFLFEGLAYRPVKGTGMSAANYYRLLGTIEPGQCTIIEDEADGIDDDKDKMKILKTGYEYNGKIPKINMNTKEQGQQWFFTYGFKLLLAERSPRIHKARGVLDRTFMMHPRPGKPKERIPIKDVLTAKSRIGNATENSRELALFEEIDNLRKLLLCHRLIHHHDLLAEIESGLNNRNAELANPTLRYFFGCGCVKNVIESLEFFLNQRNDRNTNSVEAVIYSIIHRFVSKGELEVHFKEIWDELRKLVPGINKTEETEKTVIEDEFTKSGQVTKRERDDYTKHVTEDYGVLYYNSMLELVTDKFASGKKRSKSGIVICFDSNKINQFESRFGEAHDAKVKIELKLRPAGDGGDGGDSNTLGDINVQCSTAAIDSSDYTSSCSSSKTTTHPSLLASPASPASPSGHGQGAGAVPQLIKCPKIDCGFQDIHLEDLIHHIRYTDSHDLCLISKVEGGVSMLALSLGISNKIKIVTEEANEKLENKDQYVWYNSILIFNAKPTKSGPPRKYGCSDCGYRNWVYDSVFQHICREHYKIYIEKECLKNDQYVEALKIIDKNIETKFLDPSFTTFELERARETFIKYNSMNQRYFKKLLPSNDAYVILKNVESRLRNKK